MSRPPVLRLSHDETIADNFAGGGGASLGIERGLGRSPDVAINHDPEAIAMHQANHPGTRHYTENVWKVDPREVCKTRPALAWFSPDCKHFSKAKGGKPVDKNIRGLAWVVVRWAKAVRPRVICLENVEEFEDWGPLGPDNLPDPARRGLTFKIWKGKLEALGYRIEYRELVAADFGAPTTRKRLFLVARCDGLPIVWPKRTHGGALIPWRTAAECIDWSLPTYSIFMGAEEARKHGIRRPLAENTMRRIARGLHKFVIHNPRPFIVPVMRQGQAPRARAVDLPMPTIVPSQNGAQLVAAFLAKHNAGHEATGQELGEPAHTIVGRDQKALVASSLVKLKGTAKDGQQLDLPLHTVQAGGFHYAETRAFLLKYYGPDQDPRLEEPLHTVTARDRHGLVLVQGTPYVIADIGMRMLSPRELFRAQGFDDDYVIDPVVNGRPLPKDAQVRCVGNSVCPPVAEALARAQFEDQVIEVAA